MTIDSYTVHNSARRSHVKLKHQTTLLCQCGADVEEWTN